MSSTIRQADRTPDKASAVRSKPEEATGSTRDIGSRKDGGPAWPSDPPIAFHRRLLQQLDGPTRSIERASHIASLQRAYGNRYVQEVLKDAAAPAAGDAPSPAAIAQPGRPLDGATRNDMERRFGRSFPDVRVHTGRDAAEAARLLGARAFTAGQDIYFGEGEFQPGTPQGKGLLAHELTHTLQQGSGRAPAGPQRAAVASSPGDPLEAEADRVAAAVVGANPALPAPGVTVTRAVAPSLQRQSTTATRTEQPQPPPGYFTTDLGGLKIKQEEILAHKGKGRYTRDLSSMSVPGMKLKELSLDISRSTGEVLGGHVATRLTVPFVKVQGPEPRIGIDKTGAASLEVKARLQVSALNEPQVTVTLEKGDLAAEVTLGAEKLKPAGLPKLKIPRAAVTVGIAKGQLYGSGPVELEYEGLAAGGFTASFKNGQPAGKGSIDLLPEYLKGTKATVEMADGTLRGDISLPASKLRPAVPGLKIVDGTVSVGLEDTKLIGKGENIKFDYQGLGSGVFSFAIQRDHAEGSGSLNLTIPGLLPVKGDLRYQAGRLAGKATITADKFPKGLPIKNGSITVLVDEKGGVSGSGSVGIELAGAGRGQLRFGYEKGVAELAAEVELTKIPALEAGRVLIGVKDGRLSGEAEIGIAPKQMPGMKGHLLVAYKDDRFSGKAKVGYGRDKFSGEVVLILDQDDKGKMAVSGSGELTARLTDWLTGTVHIDVLPDTTTRIAGQLKADDIELFPERKADRELFNVSQNIPLWAILVAVVRTRGGVRAGIGPGRLRGITADGEFSTVPGEGPSFTITGELFIPAYAEAYIAFGAGLGLDVVIGSLTGGIEAVGTAGVYGAVSVVPEIAYRDGNFSITGTATLAAGAKLKLGLQAWAEVEALWITVWSKEWQLGEWMWDVGPELALQAQLNYVFGRPEPPTLDFKTSDIDAKRLIQDAMPKDGPKGSGAREALKNRADWKGKLREQRKDASTLPAGLAERQGAAPTPKGLPPKRPKAAPPADLRSKDPSKVKAEALQELKEQQAPSAVKEPDKAHQERFNKGMAAVDQLAARALTDPEDPEEIAKHLAKIKEVHGFKVLTHRLEGQEWLIEAGMSPSAYRRVKGDEGNPKELQTGTYADLQGPTGDKLTPDHEPQNALMTYVSQDLRFRGKNLFEGTALENYSMRHGICLNMFEDRHKQTRTYGSKGSATKTQAVGEIKDALSRLPANASDRRARNAVGEVVKGQLAQDHDAVRGIYRSSSGLSQKTKDRVDGALRSVHGINRSTYFGAFDEA